MRNRGAIILIAVLLTLICLYYLSFTFAVNRAERKAADYAERIFNSMSFDEELPEYQELRIVDSLNSRYLDSISDKVVFSMFKKYTYMECKERELNLGLDLRGGMNITLEISAEDIIIALANKKTDSTLNAALVKTRELNERETGRNFIDVFGLAYQEVRGVNSPSLASLFISTSHQDITARSTDEEVLAFISTEYESAIDNAFEVLRKRIDHYGVVQPNIQRDVAVRGVFHIELPGIKDPERVEDLLRQAAVLDFWETYNVDDIFESLEEANKVLAQIKQQEHQALMFGKDRGEDQLDSEQIQSDDVILPDASIDEVNESDENVILPDVIFAEGEEPVIETDELVTKDTLFEEEDFTTGFSLFDRLRLQLESGHQAYGPVVGFVRESDMESVMADLNRESIKRILPADLTFAWSFKPLKDAPGYYELIALKRSRQGGAVLGGDVVTGAREEFGQRAATAEVTMTMSGAGANEWARITRDNIGKSIAIVLDGYVYSWPTVNDEIKGGRSQITGNFTFNEAKDLANVLKSGRMPAPTKILSKEIVGPSLGQKAIDSGLNSFVLAFLVVLIYMIVYYGRAGWIADIALLSNVFFIFGVLASLGAVLTLPGIAGIILTIGMSVDANVLIYERIKEELRAGKGVKLAVADGYKNAYSAIIDANITTLLIAIILFNFGVGPIQGFATTLIIGILCSLFSAIFITRLVFTYLLNKEKKITVATKLTQNAFANMSINFLEKRKIAYIISGIFIVISIGSLVTRGLNPGIDFAGGRNYVVEFKKEVVPDEIASALNEVYGETPIVRTFGTSNQVKITTKFKIDDSDADGLADTLLFQGLEPFLEEGTSIGDFFEDYRKSSQKVGPTIADDIKAKSVVAIFISLIVIFLYILLRFKKWQYSLGAIAALVHDVLFIVGLFSLFYTIMPFSMEIDQAFIAAILTVVGYSVNDTVVVFDRIREYSGIYRKRETQRNMNDALNSVISRTFSTSLSTLFVLLAIFIFGGEVIRGFIFALLIGVIVGTYSSLFIATPIAYELMKKKPAGDEKSKR
jgi:SecD/SecF fusion protein